jgi:hypothetical protein
MDKVWTAHKDGILLREKANGQSASAIAAILGTTRNAVLGRLHGLLHRAVSRYEIRRKQAVAKRALERRAAAAAILLMKRDLHRGVERDKAYDAANRAGASCDRIGQEQRISGGRVRQLIRRYRNSI